MGGLSGGQTLKGAIKNHSYDQYVLVVATISQSTATQIKLTEKKKKPKVRPQITLTMKVFDGERKLLDKKRTTLNDFEELKSCTKVFLNSRRTQSEVLSADN